MTSPPTLVFDLDGTLAQTAPDIMGTLNHLLAREGLAPLPLSKAGMLVGAGARALLQRGFQVAGQPLSEPKLDALFADFLIHYFDHVADHSYMFEGAVPALETLAAKGHRLAVCTNKPERHAVKLLEILQVQPFFAAITGRDTFDFCKPDPRHLFETIRLAGGDAGRAIMIGDSRTDIDTARAAGLPVIGVPFGYSDVPMIDLSPDRLIHHFDALIEAVESLAQG
jgi:phosphoglycolate phosphatase